MYLIAERNEDLCPEVKILGSQVPERASIVPLFRGPADVGVNWPILQQESSFHHSMTLQDTVDFAQSLTFTVYELVCGRPTIAANTIVRNTYINYIQNRRSVTACFRHAARGWRRSCSWPCSGWSMQAESALHLLHRPACGSVGAARRAPSGAEPADTRNHALYCRCTERSKIALPVVVIAASPPPVSTLPSTQVS